MGKLLSSLLGSVYGYAAAAVLAGCLSGYVIHRFDKSALDEQKLAASEAAFKVAEAVQKSEQTASKIAVSRAVAEAKAQQDVLLKTITIQEKVPVYVQDNAHCITYGLVRVLNAAARGTDPSAVSDAAGQPDDACAPVSWRDFARDLTDDYGAGRANAEQLNQLEGVIREFESTQLPQQ